MKFDDEEVALGPACLKLGSGATPRGGKKSYVPDGPVALIRSQNITNEGFDFEGLARITYEQAGRLDGVTVLEGDVLLNITGDSVARVCQVLAEVLPARVNQHVTIIRPDPEQIDPAFLRYYLASPKQQEWLLTLASSGATRNALTKGMIEQLKIPKIPIEKQRVIGAFLGDFDRKIKANIKKAKALEGIARAVFKSWFIDFEPVKLRSNVQVEACVTKEHAILFPKKLVEKEGRAIPDGWSLGCFSNVCENIKVNVRGEEIRDDDLYVGLEHVPRRNLQILTWGSGKEVSSNKYRFQEDDLLFGKLRPYFHKIVIAPAKGICSTDILVIRANEYFWHSFVILGLSRAEIVDAVSVQAGGTRMPRTNWDVVGGQVITLPDEATVKAFDEVCKPLLTRIKVLARESRLQAELRDALLPRLIEESLPVQAKNHIAA